MTHVFHRQPKQTLKRAVSGNGIYVVDQDAKQYIDASGGAAVTCLGHGHPVVTQAIKDQLDKIAYIHSGFFTTQATEDLADFLVKRSPGDLNHVYFLSGGSEAIETALKLARQYFVEAGQPNKRHFIARRQSYHGNTLGALGIGGNAMRREMFLPLLVPAHHVSPCYMYRDQLSTETQEQYGQRLADELEAKILELGAETVAAFVAETVVGATAGVLTPAKGYLQAIRAVCDKYDVLLILDEVMSGSGRTGYLFACDEHDVAPDILTMAKGLGAGYQPIGATLVSDKIFNTIVNGSGFFQHGHTYMAHASACAAALSVQRFIEQENLLENVKKRGEQMRAELRDAIGNHANVGDIRGAGLFIGVEFVKDRETKQTLDPALKTHAKLKAAAFENGLMIYPSGGTVNGVDGDHVLLAPPYICTPAEISEIVQRFAKTVGSVL